MHDEMGSLRCGDVVSGFLLVSVDDLPDYNGKGYLFRHELTSMEVYQVVNDDPELFFAYAFRTPPYNDNGVAHIIEHSVLAGSKKYPVRDPFMALLKGSTNTFMNAMTYADRTVYPAASPLRKDFDNLFDVYSDAVFAPLLRKETFWQEGIRVVPAEDGTLRYEGVVFNEMLGDSSDHDSVVGRYSVRSLFPDTPYSFESGGSPVAITQLDYTQFKSFYAQHYHPSNCRLFIFGDLEPGFRLNFLEETYLQGYSHIAGVGPSPFSEPWSVPRQMVVTSPSDEDGQSDASVTLSWATSCGEDPLELTTLSTLVDILLGNPGAPLYKAIIESHIGTDLCPESGMSADFRQMPFVVGFKGIDPQRAEEAQAFLLRTLKKLSQEGLVRGEVQAALKRQEFRQQEIAGGMPNGFRAMSRAMRGWVQGHSPSVTIGTSAPLLQLKDLVAAAYEHADEAQDPSLGYFEQWITKYIVENQHRCLLTVIPDSEHSAKQRQQLERQLQQLRSSMDKKQFKALVERYRQFEDFENQGDSPEAAATVPCLSLDDLPREIKTIEQTLHTVSDRPVWFQPQFTNGIAYVDMAITLDDLGEQDMLLMPLFTRLLQMTGMGDMDYSHVAMSIRNLTGGFFAYIESGTTLQVVQDKRDGATLLMLRVKALEHDVAQAIAFIGQLLHDANMNDRERMVAALVDLKTEYEGNVMYSGSSFATLRATSSLNAMLEQGEALSGLYQWLHLCSFDVEDAAQMKQLAASLRKLQHLLCARSRFVLHVTADESSWDELHVVCKDFLETFPLQDELLIPHQRSFSLVDSADTQVFRIPSTVSYTSLATLSAYPGTALQSAQVVLANILSTTGLWDRIRGKGGAYGVECHVDVLEQTFSYSSYRDPRIAGTFADYRKTVEEAMDSLFDQKALDNALITLIGQDLRPVAPQERAILGFRRLLYGIDDTFRSQRRQQMLALGVEDLQAGAKALVQSLDAQQRRVVLAGQELISQEAKSMPALQVEAVRLPL